MKPTNVTRREFIKGMTAAGMAAQSIPLLGAGARQAVKKRPAEQSMRWNQRLDGLWSFHPEHTLAPAVRPQDPALRDDAWPEIDVPNFWRPNEYWLWTGQHKASQDYWRGEMERVGRYRFDYSATRAGWYRKWVDLPASTQGQRIFLRFWAVAQVAQVWWNGQPVGSHLGMFGPFECEATAAARPGRNLLTVFVAGGCLAERTDVELIKRRGVTVDVTSPWLDDLPQSCYWMCGARGGGGIWQSVDIWATDPVRIEDVFFRPQLDGGSIDVTVDNGGLSQMVDRKLRFSITDRATGALLMREEPLKIHMYGQRKTVTLEIPKVSPKLWSPGNPNLYDLRVELWDGSAKRDESCHAVGFRTISVQGTDFLLNDKPYYLRGATMPPYGLAPWDRGLADRYLGLLRDGNQVVTAFNETGGNDVWCEAADEIGIGMIDQGPWTWALTGISNSDNPAPGLLDAWRKMHFELVRAVRNHPCILLRSINDEMWFHYHPPLALANPPDRGNFDDKDEKRRHGKWKIISDVIKQTREVDGTRPIGAGGGYARCPEEWKQLEPLGIDDGDFDNVHVFNGTYGPSYLALDVRRDIEQRYSMGGRPLISDQAGTGYPDNDLGYPVDAYVDKHMSPQAWMGRFIYDPRLSYQDVNGQIIKDGFERVRCRKSMIAGWLIFSNCQWFQHVHDAKRIKTYPKIYDGAALALSPILIALDSSARRFIAGEKTPLRFVAAHDDLAQGRLEGLRVVWQWMDGKRPLDRGEMPLPPLDYYGRSTVEVEAAVPEVPDKPCCRAELILELFSGSKRLSQNRYPVMIARREWYRAGADEKLPVVLAGRDPAWTDTLHELGIPFMIIETPEWKILSTDQPLILPEATPWKIDPKKLKEFVNRGGRVLCHDPSAATARQLGFNCEPVHEHFTQIIWDRPAGAWGAEYVDLSTLHPLSAGLDPVYDMRWWNPQGEIMPCVSTKVLSAPDRQSGKVGILGKPATEICGYVAPHGYYRAPWDFEKLFKRPMLSEATLGEGRIIAGCFRLAADPVARRFLLNLARYLHRPSAFVGHRAAADW